MLEKEKLQYMRVRAIYRLGAEQFVHTWKVQ